MTESINKAGGNANMATYKQIQEYLKYNYGFVPKTCWIAHMKEFAVFMLKMLPIGFHLINVKSRVQLISKNILKKRLNILI